MKQKIAKKKSYLGDGVYAWHDGFHIILEAENENGWNRIYLDASALYSLEQFIEYVSDSRGEDQFED